MGVYAHAQAWGTSTLSKADALPYRNLTAQQKTSTQQHATVRVSPQAMKTYLRAVVCCRRCAGRLCPGRRAVRAVEPRVASTTALRCVQTVGGTKLSRRTRIRPSRCAVPPGFTHRCIEVQAQRCQPGIVPVSPTYNQLSTRASQRGRGEGEGGRGHHAPVGCCNRHR